jgi:phage-related protein
VEVVYYRDLRGAHPVMEYIESVHRSGGRSVIGMFTRIVDLLTEQGPAIPMPYARLIDRRSRLYEARFGDHRAAYAEHDGHIVLLHAWRKRTQKLDEREAERARARLADWRARERRT